MLAVLTPSNRKDKKYSAILVEDGKVKTIHFGAQGYDDFTTHKDDKRKELYIKRHGSKEDWEDIHKAGFWAKNILWNKDTIEESAKDIENRYNIKIVLAL